MYPKALGTSNLGPLRGVSSKLVNWSGHWSALPALSFGASRRFHRPTPRRRATRRQWRLLVARCRLPRRSPIWRVRADRFGCPHHRHANLPPVRTAEAKAAMRKVLEVLCANQAELQALILECGADQVIPADRLPQRDAAAPVRRRRPPPAISLPPRAASAAAKEDGIADPGPAENPRGSDAGGGLPASAYGCAAPRPCTPRPCACGS